MASDSKFRIDFKKAAMAALALLSVTGCESRADLDRKPDVVEAMIKDSISTCTMPYTAAQARAKLSKIFSDVRTARLDTLRANHVTVCLDTRLSQQDTSGLFTKTMLGVYYSGAASVNGQMRSIATLWDNGQTVDKDGFWHMDASDKGAETIGKLARSIESHGAPAAGENKVAAEYSHSHRCGKSTCTSHYVEWHAGSNFTKNMKKNPTLRYAPTRAQW